MENLCDTSDEQLDIKEIYKEHDLYLLDSLAEKLFGIKDLSANISKIKEILNGSSNSI